MKKKQTGREHIPHRCLWLSFSLLVAFVLVVTCTELVSKRKQEQTEKQLKEGPRCPFLWFLVVSVVGIMPTCWMSLSSSYVVQCAWTCWTSRHQRGWQQISHNIVNEVEGLMKKISMRTKISLLSVNISHWKAAAWRPGFGFSNMQAGPKPLGSRHHGPAWLGLFGPGLAQLMHLGFGLKRLRLDKVLKYLNYQ